ncbi:MAG TPA: amidohydrolase [Ktedonobacterales bacterium]|jgi:imidazolonepropionase-like amidohydrolase
MIAITGGRILTASGPEVADGVVLIDGGKIVSVGRDERAPEGVEVIDARGKVITPGLIDAHTHLGLDEQGVGAAGDDTNESVEPIAPQLRALDGINLEDIAFDDARQAGVTTSEVKPGSGNVIGGQCVVIKHTGLIIDKVVLRAPSAIKAAMGENPKFTYRNQKKSPSTRMATAALFREIFSRAQTYLEKRRAELEAGRPFERDLKLEAIGLALEKRIPMRIHAHRADDIMTALRLRDEFGFEMSVEHCTEGHKVADELARRGVPAVVGPSMSGRYKVELRDKTFETPAVLAAAGVKVAITTDHPVVPIHQLMTAAILAVKHGLSTDLALRAVTLHPAEILGVAERVGSLDAGKDADLVIWSGDPFDLRSRVMLTMIDGQVVYQEGYRED